MLGILFLIPDWEMANRERKMHLAQLIKRADL